MIKKGLLLCVFSFLIMSCGASKKITSSIKKDTPTIVDKIIWTAVSYKGTPYKYGGITRKGMDCSGLVYTSFKQRGITIPRVSYLIEKEGTTISLKKVERGDLLFFKTSKKGNRINHLGLVTSTKNGIKFIHASSSKGVVVSSLLEPYWKNAYIKAKRML